MFDFEETLYIDSREEHADFHLSRRLAALLLDFPQPPVFLCIGSDKVRGDSLGPLIGSMLLQKGGSFPVIGSLDLPVHALNLSEAIFYIQNTYPNHPVVAIDASLGLREHLHYLTIGKGGLQPGAGVHKSLGVVGNIFLTGIVAPAGPFSQLALKTVPLSMITELASTMTKGILNALKLRPAALL